MKKIIIVIGLVLIGSQVFAQKKINTNFRIFEVDIKFKNSEQAKGALFGITDSTLTLGNAFVKEKYVNGEYRVYTYSLDRIEKINRQRIWHNKNRLSWTTMIIKYNRKAIVKSDLGYDLERKQLCAAYDLKRKQKQDNKLVLPSISIGISDAIYVNTEYPIWKWVSLDVSIGITTSNVESLRDLEDFTVESKIHVEDDVNVHFGNIQNLDVEYVPVPTWWGDADPYELGLLKLGPALFLPMKRNPFSISAKAYLWRNKSHTILPYVKVGGIFNPVKGRDVRFDITKIELYDASSGNRRYSVTEKVSFGPIKLIWANTPLVNLGCSFHLGKRRHFLLDMEYQFVKATHIGNYSIWKGRYSYIEGGLKGFHLSLGYVL